MPTVKTSSEEFLYFFSISCHASYRLKTEIYTVSVFTLRFLSETQTSCLVKNMHLLHQFLVDFSTGCTNNAYLANVRVFKTEMLAISANILAIIGKIKKHS